MGNGIIDWVVEHTLAGWLSRVCGKYSALVAVIFGGLGATLAAVSQAPGLPHNYAVAAGAAGAVLVAVAGLMGHQNGAPVQGIGLKASLFILACLLVAGQARAQSTASLAASNLPAPASAAPSSLFNATSEATAFHFNGAWSIASHTTESFDLIDWGKTKANSFAVEGHEITAPTPGYTIVVGGGRYTPNLAPLVARTNLPAGTFGLYFQGAVGVTSAPSNHIAVLAGGGVQYRVTSSVTWSSLHIGYLRLGAQDAAEISTGLQYFFK